MAFVNKGACLLKHSGSKHVSMGLSSSGSPFFQAIRSMSSAKIFVGGLAHMTDEMGLREAFQKYGEVIDARVILDRDSGRSRGFGFVSYASPYEANGAIEYMDGKELHGRRIRVTFAQDRPRPKFAGGGDGMFGGGSAYSGGFGGSYDGPGGYSGSGGYRSSDGFGDRNNNLGGYGGRNQNGGGDLIKILRSARGVSPVGGNEDDVGGNLNHDL